MSTDQQPKKSLPAGLTALLVFASLAGIGMAAFLPDLRQVGIVVVLAVLCVCVALFMRAVWPTRWVGVTSAVTLGSAGVMAVMNVRTTLVGTLLIFLAAGVTTHLILGIWIGRHTGRARRRAAALALVAAVLIPVGGLAFIANDARHGGAYAGRYGTPVTVTIGDVCTFSVSFGLGAGDSTSALRCPALWAVDGGYQSGVIYGPGEAMGPGDTEVSAYAVGNRAWHPSMTQDNGLTLLAHVIPRWLIACALVGLALAALIIITSRRSNPVLPSVIDPFDPPRR